MTNVHYCLGQRDNHYSIYVGKFNIGKAHNVQYFSEVDVGHIRNSTVPTNDGPHPWMNVTDLIGTTGFNAIKNNEDFLKELLPDTYHGFIADWEILVLFSSVVKKGMRKACLRNNDTNEICLITSWDQVFDCKTKAAAKDGWWVCNTHMLAPAAFYAAVKCAL